MTEDQRDHPDKGGPAFPQSPVYWEGMTLRDYFAAAALTGLIAEGLDYRSERRNHIYGLAYRAYAVADALLEARKPPVKEGE